MKRRVLFITGTDTGAGKTVLACLLTRAWRNAGVDVAALKPVCSGGRDDAMALREAMGDRLGLEAINPWHFRAAIAPLLAARTERKRVRAARVVAHVRKVQRRFPFLILEGAGGLLSPLGEDFDSRGLIERLDAWPVVVSPNRLGAINQVRLVMEALGKKPARRAQIVLMGDQERTDAASGTNARLLREIFGQDRVLVLPHFGKPLRVDLSDRRVRKAVKSLLSWLQGHRTGRGA